MKKQISFSVLLALSFACAATTDSDSEQKAAAEKSTAAKSATKPSAVTASTPSTTFDAKQISADIKALSSDEMEGRAPASKGEELATNYIANAFKTAGLEPAGQDENFFQKVPLVGIDANPEMSLHVKTKAGVKQLRYGSEFMAWTKQEVQSIASSGDLLFVGYGTVAPEFHWDDYKGVDCTGKILVMLVNDPPLLDERKFAGRAMTYYGRWTYKYEIGAQKGASGVLLIHETDRAGYPWEVVSGSWAGEQFDMLKKNGGQGSVLPMQGWVTHAIGEQLFEAAGLNLVEWKKKAAREDFRPVSLQANASIEIRNSLRTIDSKNVIGILPGSHSKKKHEYIVYTAHWDHLGVGPEVKGDKIYNGAIDNATGVSGLIALAKAFANAPKRPDRSIVFLAVAAEEQGLLGSKYYSEHPIFPLNRTVANINIDGMNMLGRTKDLIVVGLGNSELDDFVKQAAEEQGRSILPDQEPEKGFFYRSDQFNFAKKGVPSLYTDPGMEYVGKHKNWGKEQSDRYTAERYHKPQDEFDANWNYEGMIEDLELLFKVGYRVSQQDRYVEWKPGTEFKALREESLKQAQ